MLVYGILKKTLKGNPNLTYEEQTNKKQSKKKYTCENKLEQRRIKQKN